MSDLQLNYCVECFQPLDVGHICDRCQCEISGDFDHLREDENDG